jgi:DNA-binding transcriptional MerR regulator
MKAVYGVNDAARYLGVSKSKLAVWSERTGIGLRSEAGCISFSDDDLKALELIRSLREEDRSFDTIVRRIRPIAATSPALIAEPGSPPAPPPTADPEDTLSLVEQVTAAVTTAIRADLRMGEKYGQAMQRLCELQWEVRQLHDAQSQAETAYRLEVACLRVEIEELAAALAAEQDRPWWQRLLGLN